MTTTDDRARAGIINTFREVAVPALKKITPEEWEEFGKYKFALKCERSKTIRELDKKIKDHNDFVKGVKNLQYKCVVGARTGKQAKIDEMKKEILNDGTSEFFGKIKTPAEEKVVVTLPDDLPQIEKPTEEEFVKQCWGKAFIQINLYALWRWQHLLSQSGINSKKQVRNEILAAIDEAQNQLAKVVHTDEERKNNDSISSK